MTAPFVTRGRKPAIVARAGQFGFDAANRQVFLPPIAGEPEGPPSVAIVIAATPTTPPMTSYMSPDEARALDLEAAAVEEAAG